VVSADIRIDGDERAAAGCPLAALFGVAVVS